MQFQLRTWILIIVVAALAVGVVLYALARTTETGGNASTPVPVSQSFSAPRGSLPTGTVG